MEMLHAEYGHFREQSIPAAVPEDEWHLTMRQKGVTMKIAKFVIGIALMAVTLACGTAWADRGHGRGGVSLGINLGVPLGPWYYPPHYYPYPPLVAVQPPPPVYIERGAEASAPPTPSSNYWYYCPDPQGYYPYVKECQSGWMTVLPQSPGQPR
jgi:hypothetical protein